MKIINNHTPALDQATVEFALRLAPAMCPLPTDSGREIWMKAGEHRLAMKLQTHLKKQEANYVP